MSPNEGEEILGIEQRVSQKLDSLRNERPGEHIELMNFLHQLCLAAFPYPPLKIDVYDQYGFQQAFPVAGGALDSDIEFVRYYQRPEKEDYERDLEEALDDIRSTSRSAGNYLNFIAFIEKVVDHATDYREVYDGKPEPFPSSVTDFVEEYDFLLTPIPEDFNLFDATRDKGARAKAAELGIDLSGGTINVKRTFEYQSPLEVSPESFAERIEKRLFPYLKEKFCSEDWQWEPSRKTSSKYGITRFSYAVPTYFQMRFDIDRDRNASLTILGLKQFVDSAIQDLELGKRLL